MFYLIYCVMSVLIAIKYITCQCTFQLFSNSSPLNLWILQLTIEIYLPVQLQIVPPFKLSFKLLTLVIHLHEKARLSKQNVNPLRVFITIEFFPLH
jgi:hypothetical protein